MGGSQMSKLTRKPLPQGHKTEPSRKAGELPGKGRLPEDTTNLGGSVQRVVLGSDKATDTGRLAIPTQIERLAKAIKGNLDRVHGLVARGDYWAAAEVVRKFLGPQIGTSRALVDRLNQLEPGHITEPLLATHIEPKVKVKRRQYARWAEK